jgi:hypothetical protein
LQSNTIHGKCTVTASLTTLLAIPTRVGVGVGVALRARSFLCRPACEPVQGTPSWSVPRCTTIFVWEGRVRGWYVHAAAAGGGRPGRGVSASASTSGTRQSNAIFLASDTHATGMPAWAHGMDRPLHSRCHRLGQDRPETTAKGPAPRHASPCVGRLSRCQLLSF